MRNNQSQKIELKNEFGQSIVKDENMPIHQKKAFDYQVFRAYFGQFCSSSAESLKRPMAEFENDEDEEIGDENEPMFDN